MGECRIHYETRVEGRIVNVSGSSVGSEFLLDFSLTVTSSVMFGGVSVVREGNVLGLGLEAGKSSRRGVVEDF